MQRQHALRRALYNSPHFARVPDRAQVIHDLTQRVEVVDERYSNRNYPHRAYRAYLRVVKPILVFKGVHAICGHRYAHNAIAELELPVGAVFHFSSRDAKCRATRARVVCIYPIEGPPPYRAACLPMPVPAKAHSVHDPKFYYTVGEVVRPTKRFGREFDHAVCASGIHFYFDQRDAIGFIC